MSSYLPSLFDAGAARREPTPRIHPLRKTLRIFHSYDPRYPLPRRSHDPQALADNLAFCARPCCRNPRRIFTGSDRLPCQDVRALNHVAPEGRVGTSCILIKHSGLR